MDLHQIENVNSKFMLLGSGDKHLLHTDTFDFDMDILATGVEAYKTIARKYD